jgi:hypothetical protein
MALRRVTDEDVLNAIIATESWCQLRTRANLAV